MGKMKELYMQTYFPNEDTEREYLMNDLICKSWEYEEYLALKKDPEMQLDQSKIEIKNESRIEVFEEEEKTDRETKISSDGF